MIYLLVTIEVKSWIFSLIELQQATEIALKPVASCFATLQLCPAGQLLIVVPKVLSRTSQGKWLHCIEANSSSNRPNKSCV